MAAMDAPNGEPGSSPAGAWAVIRSPQQAQRPPNSRAWVTSGLTGGNPMRSQTRCAVWEASGNAASHPGQAASRASTTRSGFGWSTRPAPGRLARGGRVLPSGWFRFCAWDGGLEELSGVFGGRVSSPGRASSAAVFPWAAASCANSARISASFSSGLRRVRSGGVTPRLESTRP